MGKAVRKKNLEDLISGPALTTKFRNRSSAGNLLSSVLEDYIREYTSKDIIVIGIARGGLLIADVVSTKFNLRLAPLFVKRLVAPLNREISLGAVTADGTTYLNKPLIKGLNVSKKYLDFELASKKREVKQLLKLYCDRVVFPKIKGKVVILIDDGIATGSTMVVAARWVNKSYPKRLIIASPVSPFRTLRLLKREADLIEIIATPSIANFISVDQFYEDFGQVSESMVTRILQKQMI